MQYLRNNWTSILFSVAIAAAFFGYKFYNKNETKKEIKAQVTSLCEGDEACLSAMETHYEECFTKSYRLGGRRRAGGLNTDKFVACFNEAAGDTYLSVEEEDPAS